MEALAALAAELAQRDARRLVLDPLGDDEQAERVCHLDRRANDGEARGVGGGAADVGLIELEDAGGQALEQRERGPAGAEVVDRDREAEVADAVEHLQRVGLLLEAEALGDLDPELAGLEAVAREAL